MLKKLLFIFVGGGFGSVMRYWVQGFIQENIQTHPVFPWGTMIVNISGSFVIGLLWMVFQKYNFNAELRLFVFVGILGGYTTFSSLMMESYNLAYDAELKYTLMNILLSCLLGFAAVYGGALAGKLFFK